MTYSGETAPGYPPVEALTSLTDADVQDFTGLLAQLSSTPRTIEQVRHNLETALASPTTRVAVMRGENGRIIVTATGNLCPIPTGYKPWIDDVVTDESCRGRGYGRRIMETLHGWLEEIEVPYVNLTSTPDKAAAGNLYENMGYERRNTRVYRKRFLGATATKDQVPA